MSTMDAILSLNIGEHVVITNAADNTVRCAASTASKRWGRKFSVNKSPVGLVVRRIPAFPSPDQLRDAAPEMLAALQCIAEFDEYEPAGPAARTARAAIAKATGEQA